MVSVLSHDEFQAEQSKVTAMCTSKVNAMDLDAAIKYVGMQSLTTLDYVP